MSEFRPNPESEHDTYLLRVIGELCMEFERRSSEERKLYYLDVYPEDPNDPTRYVIELEIKG